ncbi:hypothetical protein QBC38DRAFT_467004 [Podospora fimiseda]|uniref:Small ribosomal subunit protein mS38 n=1 Tax=Podospora fimiseda TaxID=252190 RepID=A0AAN7BX21_9PEZI|nr:hypothetical protein QBC38DRAFT_467004 [Podospora fimiseda]
MTMLPSSAARRVVAAAATASAPAIVVSSLAPAAPKTGATFTLPYRPTGLHQRRYSSSKPSNPSDGSRDFDARPSVPSSGSSKTIGEKRKRKTKDAAAQLPSVPSTKHIKDEGFALSTFFALHRPISVTQLLPQPVTEDAFAQIFAPRSRSHRVQEVLSTLSQTVQDLEEPLKVNNNANGVKQQQQQSSSSSSSHEGAQEVEADGSTKLTYKRLDGTEANVYLQLNTSDGQFLPYSPPPPPQPITEVDAETEATMNAIADELTSPDEPQTRVYKAMVTIEETMDEDGQYKVVAHSPELIEESPEPQPRTFLERMAQRQLRFDEVRRQQGRTMQAISVKRQRKLKMKKKKYKKLMRRTRNERRKLDRL